MNFEEAVRGLLAGDFSRLAPLFEAPAAGARSPIIEWYEAGRFAAEPEALAEAFTCACFNGASVVAQHLLAQGVDPNGGAATGLNAFHWAANRGQAAVVRALIWHGADPEVRNSYGGTVLGCTVWSAVNEPRPGQLEAIEALLEAGACIDDAAYPSGDARVDAIIRRHGART